MLKTIFDLHYCVFILNFPTVLFTLTEGDVLNNAELIHQEVITVL